MNKPGHATLAWIHFGTAATAVVLGGADIVKLIPGWGMPIGLVVGVAGNLVAGYLKRKDAQLTKNL